MQSAPSMERVLTYLNTHGHTYSNERNLIEACRDSKSLIELLKDLLKETEPGFIRSWMAAESYTFSHDVERNNFTLPVINEFLVICDVLGQLNVTLRLGWMFSPKAGERAIPIISRVVGFLEEKKHLMEQTEAIRVKHTLMKQACQNSNAKYVQVETRRKQTQAQKEKERPNYQQKLNELNALREQADNKEEYLKNLGKEIEQLAMEFKEEEKELSSAQRQVEQTEMKIAHCRRELIKFAPDIKKEAQHLEVKIMELKEGLQFKEKVRDRLLLQFLECEKIVSQHENTFTEQIQVITQSNERFAQLTTQQREGDEVKRQIESELGSKKEKKRKFEQQLQLLGRQGGKLGNYIEEAQQHMEEKQNLKQNDQKVKQSLKEWMTETRQYVRDLNEERSIALLKTDQARANKAAKEQNSWKSLLAWYESVRNEKKEVQSQFKSDDS